MASAVLAAEPAIGARAGAGTCEITQKELISASVAANIEFVNQTTGTVKVYWLDYSGKRVYYDSLAPGASYIQPTFRSNAWLVLNSSGSCIGYVVAPKSRYVITGSGAAVAPPVTTPACLVSPTPPGCFEVNSIFAVAAGAIKDAAASEPSTCDTLRCLINGSLIRDAKRLYQQLVTLQARLDGENAQTSLGHRALTLSASLLDSELTFAREEVTVYGAADALVGCLTNSNQVSCASGVASIAEGYAAIKRDGDAFVNAETGIVTFAHTLFGGASSTTPA